MNIPAAIGSLFGVAIALMALVLLPPCAYAQATAGSNVIILLRFAGDSGTTPKLRSCLTSRLSKMPDTEVVAAPTDGVRFVVDIIAKKRAIEDVSASLVVAETFPLEQFRPRIKEGEDGDALLTSIRYFTLLRIHEFLLGRSPQALCAKIAAEIGNKVLSEEYTARKH
jgi:hypothetical protein